MESWREVQNADGSYARGVADSSSPSVMKLLIFFHFRIAQCKYDKGPLMFYYKLGLDPKKFKYKPNIGL